MQGFFRPSVTVEFDGVDTCRNGTSAVAAALLFRLFVSEGLAFGVLEHVVSLLTPISTRSHLKRMERMSEGNLKQTK